MERFRISLYRFLRHSLRLLHKTFTIYDLTIPVGSVVHWWIFYINRTLLLRREKQQTYVALEECVLDFREELPLETEQLPVGVQVNSHSETEKQLAVDNKDKTTANT